MYLRKLKIKDAPLMLEWMHDDSVVHDLHTNFASKTLDDCKAFILANQEYTDNVNLAIVSECRICYYGSQGFNGPWIFVVWYDSNN